MKKLKKFLLLLLLAVASSGFAQTQSGAVQTRFNKEKKDAAAHPSNLANLAILATHRRSSTLLWWLTT
jgi:hypothetical protein